MIQLALKAGFVVLVSCFLLLDGLSLITRGLGFAGLKPVPRDHPVDQILFFIFGDPAWPFVSGMLEIVGAMGVFGIFFWRAFATRERRI